MIHRFLIVLFVGYALTGLGVIGQARYLPPPSLVIFIITWFTLLVIGLTAFALETVATRRGAPSVARETPRNTEYVKRKT